MRFLRRPPGDATGASGNGIPFRLWRMELWAAKPQAHSVLYNGLGFCSISLQSEVKSDDVYLYVLMINYRFPQHDRKITKGLST